MRYKLILWDFDGTLADSLPCLLRIYNDIAVREGFRTIEDPESVRVLSVRAFLKHHRVPLLKVPFLIREALKTQRGDMENIKLFPDLPAVLTTLHQAGFRMGVLSSNTEENIRACLSANGVENLFEAVVGYRRLFGKGKALRRFLRQHRIDPSDVIYLGDELRDIEAAREAGVAVGSVTWGYQAPHILAAAQPAFLVDQPGEIVRHLDVAASA